MNQLNKTESANVICLFWFRGIDFYQNFFLRYLLYDKFPLTLSDMSVFCYVFQAVQDSHQHSVSYTLSRNQAVIVEYKEDPDTDMFQVCT